MRPLQTQAALQLARLHEPVLLLLLLLLHLHLLHLRLHVMLRVKGKLLLQERLLSVEWCSRRLPECRGRPGRDWLRHEPAAVRAAGAVPSSWRREGHGGRN